MSIMNPIRLEVYRNLFHSVAEEMGVALCRTAFSPNIKERKDYSCAIFDGQGRMVAQGDHMPVHLGSMPESVAAVLSEMTLKPGDMAIVNDPFKGGTHLPDITLIQAVYLPHCEEPSFYVANRAHHSDVGGISPGSMPLATSIYQEGLRIPPVLLVENGKLNQAVLIMILTNVRTPIEREGDLTAQIASNRTGERRLLEMVDKYGISEVDDYMAHLQNYGERLMRAAIHDIADGNYTFEDAMEDDGLGNGPFSICVTVTIAGDEVIVDFTGTSPQAAGGINANEAITLSAVLYCFRCILPYTVPSNHGTMCPLKIITPPGTLVNALEPSAMAGGNVETSQRIVDAVFGALAKALPDRIPAASSGTMNNLTLGGINPSTGKTYAYYETVAGGMGAGPETGGLSATHTHMTNSMNTPIEALEHSYPFLIRQYGIYRGTGGQGRFNGGDGVIREIEVLSDADLTIISDRRINGPYGLNGGDDGAVGRNSIVHPNGDEENLPSKCSTKLIAGSVVRICTPGGGGHGKRRL